MSVNDGPQVVVAILLLRGKLVLINLEAISVIPFVILGVEGGKIGSESFVQPDAGPVVRLHIISEPVLTQFVRNQLCAGIVLVGARIVERIFGQGGRADVLLASENEVVHRRLRILFIRIVNARRTGKEADHIWSEMKGSPRRRPADIIRYVIIHRLVFVLITELTPRSHSYGNQVRTVWHAFHPIVGSFVVLLCHSDKLSVRHYALSFRHRGDRF